MLPQPIEVVKHILHTKGPTAKWDAIGRGFTRTYDAAPKSSSESWRLIRHHDHPGLTEVRARLASGN